MKDTMSATVPPAPRAPKPRPISDEEIDRVVGGAHHDPHSVLGPHPHDGAVTVRVLRPWAKSVTVVGEAFKVALVHERGGVWVGVVPGAEVPDYRLSVDYGDGPLTADDPYRFIPTIGGLDLHLIGEGRHEQLWDALGAHVKSFDSVLGDVTGTSFTVWAPNARGVRVVGDFNGWDGRGTPMRSMGATGVWELFLPDVVDGATYKFQILGPDSVWRDKADPMAFDAEVPRATGSKVFTSQYTWNDDEWLAHRAATDVHTSPMSVYEVHAGSWKRGLSYRQMADELTAYVVENGFTHIEFMPIAQHPFEGSWGYQVTSYFAVNPRFGSPDDFRYLVDKLHQAGIGVIVDWVPAHFPKDEWALGRFDGTPLYEHPDPQRGEHPDWGTYIFNFGRREVRNFLVANAIFLLEQFHIDGLRVDAVASMLYLDYSRNDGEWSTNEFGGRENLDAVGFLQEMNATAYKRVPGIVTIAEESTAWPGVSRPTYTGGLGFGLKWNMGWMHDSLEYIGHEPVHRKWHHHEMTFSLVYAWSENFVLPISHDEVVHGKGSLIARMPGDRWQQLANLRSYLGFMWAHPGKQLLFMGSEFAQSAEWNDKAGLDWWLLDFPEHAGVLQAVRALNHVYRETPALYRLDESPEGFEWLEANDADNNVFAWVRKDGQGDVLVSISNFSPAVRADYRLGLPLPGSWVEVLNTDAAEFGGSGVKNAGRLESEPIGWHGRTQSVSLTIPPLSTIWLRPA
jgi:1,4-alpha-glucan branching enzyme